MPLLAGSRDHPIQPVDQPILCNPYEEPRDHWVYDRSTGQASHGGSRRAAGYWYKTDKVGTAQGNLYVEEERDDLVLVNVLRDDVRKWREADYRGAEPVTRELLRHWARADRPRRLFFCQREAVETIIYIAEIRMPGKGASLRFNLQLSDADLDKLLRGERPGFDTLQETVFPTLIDPPAGNHLLPLIRLGCKMATGSGKTVVMAMLIAWAFCNRGRNPSSRQFPNPTTDLQFVYDGWNLLMELDGLNSNAVLRKYTWGLDLGGALQSAGGVGGLLAVYDTAGTTSTSDDASYGYLYDTNGNVGQLVDFSDGSLAAKYEYDPYGGPLLDAANAGVSGPYAATNPFRFSTKYFDGEADYSNTTNDGLYYYGYRYYSPRLGRWLSRDPIGERGGLLLFGFCGNGPNSRFDPFGLQSTQPTTDNKCEFCGPDMTGFLKGLVNSAITWRRSMGRISMRQGIRWLSNNGNNLDWWSTAGHYKTQRCPSEGNCENTYWLCGECVHDHWIGNFMFGFMSRLLGVPDFIADWGADAIQGPGAGDPQVQPDGHGGIETVTYDDPPWDTAGYLLARNLFDSLRFSSTNLCFELKSRREIWDAANDTSARPDSQYLRYPTPHAEGYRHCKKCPDSLPASANSRFPGGRVGNSWPPIE